MSDVRILWNAVRMPKKGSPSDVHTDTNGEER